MANRRRSVNALRSRVAAVALCAAGVASASGGIMAAAAPPPANDECFGAVAIGGTGTFAFDLSLATTSADPVPCAPGAIGNDVWFCWTAPCSGVVTFQTCGLTTADTMIVVYFPCACPAAVLLACNDDCCGVQSLVHIQVTAGSSYMIRVGTASGSGSPGSLRIDCADLPCNPPPPPPPPPPCTRTCTDFDDAASTTQGWTQVLNGVTVVNSSGASGGLSGNFLVVTDQPSPPGGPALPFNATAFPQDWSARAMECERKGQPATLEFDVRISTDDLPGSVNASSLMTLVYDTDGNPGNNPVGVVAQASFSPSAAVNENSGWVHIVAPLPWTGSLCGGSGCWTVTTGTWQQLLANVTYLRLPVELGSGSEVWHWDNICLNCCECLRIESVAFSGDPSYFNVDYYDQGGALHTAPEEAKHGLGWMQIDDGLCARYSQVVACNTTGLAGVHDTNSRASYQVQFRMNEPPGEPWCVTVDTSRVGEITTQDDGNGSAEACVSAVVGAHIPSPPGQTAAIVDGTISLPDAAACSPGLAFSSGSGADQAISQSAKAIIAGVGPEVVTLNFQWQSTARSRPNFGDGDSVGVRIGRSTTQIPSGDINLSVCTYPGQNSRVEGDDGHFVKVKCIPCVDDYCQDFNGEFEDPASPQAVDGWTTTGPILQPIFNPGTGGAAPPPGGVGSGYLRLIDAGGSPGLGLHAPEALRGKWDCFCGCFEFDIRIFDDGATGSPNFFPSFSLVRNDGFNAPVSGASSVTATFVSTTPVNENSGWVHIKVPLVPGLQPTLGLGTWTFSQSAQQDKDWCLAHVTDVVLPGEFTSGPDIVGYDNFCLVENHDCVPPPPDLVGWWPFDEKSAPVHDVASSMPTVLAPGATPMGGAPGFGNAPSPTAGVVMGALEFDGVDDRVRVAALNANPVLFLTSDFTIDAWVKAAVADGEQPIVDRRTVTTTGAPPVGYRFFLHNGYLALGLADRNFPGETVFQSSNTSAPMIADGAWHHVAATMKRFNPSAAVKLYVDGVLVGQFSPLGKTGLVTNMAADLLIGAGPAIGGPATFFRGRIDEVEIFRRALSAAEIFSIYQAGCAGKCKCWCYTGRRQCVNSNGGAVTFKVCNATGTPKTMAWSLASGGSDASCTINSGLTFSPGSGSVTVPAYGCTNVTVSVTPPAMTFTDVACYTLTLTDPATGAHVGECEGAVTLCCLPPFKWFPVRGFESVAFNPGASVTARFGVMNTGAGAASLPYRVTVRATVEEDSAPAVRLNGLPPGEPVIGTLQIVGGATIEVPVAVRYVCYNAFSPRELVLEVDPEHDGTFMEAASIGLIGEPSPSTCPGDFSDGFEAYGPGEMCGQGGWSEWFTSVDVCGEVTTDQSFMGSNSFRMIGNTGGSTGRGDDTVRTLDAEGGHRELSVMTFVPGDAAGTGWVILLNSYPSPLNYSVDVQFDADLNAVRDFTGEQRSTPLVRDQWVPLRLDIDLDADRVNAWYGVEQFIFDKSWVNGDSGGGQPRVQALDLYAGEPSPPAPSGGTSGMYFDMVSLRNLDPCAAPDCNANSLPDEIEVIEGLAADDNLNGIPDECECPCDWNHTGTLSVQDLFDYLAGFFVGNGDFNHGGATTSQDLFDFLACFFGGCQ